MTTYICKCGRRVKKSTDASTTGNRLSGYAPGHECWGCPYAMPYGNYQWDESARTVSRETQGYECRMSKTLTYASEFAGSIKDKCTCRVHSLDFDFLSQVSAWIKDTYPDREIFGSFSKDIRASDYGSDGRYCLTITCTQNLKGVAAKRELLGQFFTPNGSRKDMTPQQEIEKILADIRKCTQEPPAAADVAVAALPPAEAAEPFGNIPAAPTFDFSALGDLSQQATEADQQFDLHYGAAQDEYLISCIYLARIHALTAKAGRYGGGTWTKWYESKGMSKSGAWNMVQTGESFNGSTIDQLKQLPELTRKDLNLIARSGCAGQLVDAAGDSQRVQELLAQLKAEKERANAAESHLEAVHADIDGLQEQCAQMSQRANDAEEARIVARLQRQKAEAERDKAEERVHDAEEALKHQPIVGVIDEKKLTVALQKRHGALQMPGTQSLPRTTQT